MKHKVTLKTHAGPAGSSHYWKYNLAPIGFSQQCFDAQVDGIVKAIIDAKKDLSPEKLTIAVGNLYQCGWNRSPRAYLQNPLPERLHYGYDPDTIEQEEGFINQEGLAYNGQETKTLPDGRVVSTGYA